MDSDGYELICCKFCHEEFAYIGKHLAKSKTCKSSYKESELQHLKLYSQTISDVERRKKRKKKYDQEYDRNKRAKMYQRKKNKVQMFKYKMELEREISKSNSCFKKKIGKHLKNQIQSLIQTNGLSKEMREEIKRIKIGIEVVYQGIQILIDDTSRCYQILEEESSNVKNLFDNIKVREIWYENDLELHNAPCQCHTCRNKNHDVLWCERVVRQRTEQKENYTCPGCQEPIHKDVFENHYDFCTKGF